MKPEEKSMKARDLIQGNYYEDDLTT